MNERIKELALQARLYAEEKQNDPYRIYTQDCFNEKFAELIIKECGEITVLGDPSYSAQHNIHKHFGVE